MDEKPGRAAFAYELAIPTRWADNDVYGHVNNTVYYRWFDTVINTWLIAEGGLDPATGEAIGLCVESGCRYFAPCAFPETVIAALRVTKLGTSSVRYEVGIFREEQLVALGHFVHVFVDRAERRPTPHPPRIRACLERLVRG